MRRLLSSVALLTAVAAWDECHFPTIDYLVQDEGVGKSATYALAAMNGKMYSGGYMKGNLALTGLHKDGVDVNPDPLAAIWGTAHSDVQSLYVAEVDETGKMTKGWHLKGTATHVGDGHVLPTNNINLGHGVHRMMDNQHLAVSGYLKGNLDMPDGTTYTTEGLGHPNSVAFVMKLQVSSRQGVGAGTTGWSKNLDTGFGGGATVYSVDGDTGGNMIVSMEGCLSYNASAVGRDYYGRPTYGASAECSKHIKKLSSADGSEVWSTATPTTLYPCRTVLDGSVYCGFSVSPSVVYDFGSGVTLTSPGVGEEDHVGVVKYGPNGLPVWARETIIKTYGGDIAVNKDGTLLAVEGTGPDTVARIDTSAGNEGNVLWEEHFDGQYTGYGIRGIEVTQNPSLGIQEVLATAQVPGNTITLTDATGASTTVRGRGSWDVFVAAFDAADGAGKWAMDLGGSGMDYKPAFASDPDTGDVYVGGYTRSELFMEANGFERKNQMYNGQSGMNNAVSSSSVGSNKAYVTKFKSKLELPECLDACDNTGATTTMTVKSGHCYIDRFCYKHEQKAPYAGAECTHCDASASATAWSSPMASDDYCVIAGSCVKAGASKPGIGYRAKDSECEQCQPDKDQGGYSMVDGYIFNDEGKCHKKTWEDEAILSGRFRALPAHCIADEAKTSRRLREAKKRKRKLSYKSGGKATYQLKDEA